MRISLIPTIDKDLRKYSTVELYYAAVRAWPTKREDGQPKADLADAISIDILLTELFDIAKQSRRFRCLCAARNMNAKRLALRIGNLVRLRSVDPLFTADRLVGHAPVGSGLTKTYYRETFDLRELSNRDLVWLAATHTI